jgi:TPP-dependent pyruvate/acetoin dehydrogenase alpha subunit
MGTAIERGTSMAHDLEKKAVGYGILGATIEGMDVMDVYDGMKPVVDACRASPGPRSSISAPTGTRATP